jgi:hypothetical protein
MRPWCGAQASIRATGKPAGHGAMPLLKLGARDQVDPRGLPARRPPSLRVARGGLLQV